MKLSAYMKQHDLDDAAFSEIVGASRFAVGKWRRGERVPRGANLDAITRATQGQVTANDFHDMSPSSVPASTAAAAQ